MKPGALSQWNVIGRRLLGFFAAWMFPLVTAAADFRISTFSVDVTIPPGHPCMGGGIAPAKELGDPLFAKGFVLTGVRCLWSWFRSIGAKFEALLLTNGRPRWRRLPERTLSVFW